MQDTFNQFVTYLCNFLGAFVILPISLLSVSAHLYLQQFENY
jgi:hypothetical protein